MAQGKGGCVHHAGPLYPLALLEPGQIGFQAPFTAFQHGHIPGLYERIKPQAGKQGGGFRLGIEEQMGAPLSIGLPHQLAHQLGASPLALQGRIYGNVLEHIAAEGTCSQDPSLFLEQHGKSRILPHAKALGLQKGPDTLQSCAC